MSITQNGVITVGVVVLDVKAPRGRTAVGGLEDGPVKLFSEWTVRTLLI